MEEERQLKSNKPACIVPGCVKDTYGGSRGMCLNHYAVKQDLVKRGRTTWEQLEKEGKALPKLDRVGKAKLRKLMRLKKRVRSEDLTTFYFVDRMNVV